MKSRQTTFTELLLKGIMWFAILTVLQGIAALDSINKIWLAVISLALVGKLSTYKYNGKQLLVLATTVIIHIISLLFTKFPLYHVNMLFYFLLWVMLYMVFAKSKDRIALILHKADAHINIILWVWTLIVGISAFIPSCYRGNYFFSFAGTSFRLMPTVLIISALAMYMAISREDKRYNLFLLLPTYSAFMNQSRVYFGVYIIFLLMYIYMLTKNKKQFYAALVPIMCAVLVLMSVSGIADKLEATKYTELSYFDFWGTITSGRTIFWEFDLEAFFELPFWQQFVGNGFNFVYEVNSANFAEIWAHNDIINILMNFGYIGVVIYLWSYFQMVRAFWPKGNKIPIFVKCMFHGAVFLNSMMNMSYTYLCAMISYPLFLYVIAAKYEEKDKGNTALFKN